ncbi:GlxA family transcriptional regulator [Pseudonocardia adelaidensis]|uniref:DJ-1/PfpI family protein n=1 Tax=Pseudonocardia adelaidensis TaxID=648754 RepID=A0ABP9P123_9PSEU
MLVVGYEGAELLEIACVTSTLIAACVEGRGAHYDVRLLTPGGRTINCADGLRIEAQGVLERHREPADTLIVVGGFGAAHAADDQRLVGHVRRLAALTRRVASVCTGAGVLAAAGLLDGRRAATHWDFAPELARRYPKVKFDPDPIYIRDGSIYTSAGVTAALDLTLALVAEDLGAELARSVARALVTYLQRPGNQAQISVHVAAPVPSDPVMREVVDHITSNLGKDLSTPALAARAGISARHLRRLFQTHVGQSPARYVRRARTEAAAQLVSSSELPLARIAERCGFGTTESLRTAFLDTYGVPPSSYAPRRAPSAGKAHLRTELRTGS